MHDRAGLEIEHHGQVLMLPSDRDLVDGDELQALESGLPEPALEVAFLNVLDQAPAHLEVPGDIEHGHVPQELEHVALEGTGIAAALVGQAGSSLLEGPAVAAMNALDRHIEHHRPASDRYAMQPSAQAALADHPIRSATGAAQSLGITAQAEDHLALLILGAFVLVAPDPKAVIQ